MDEYKGKVRVAFKHNPLPFHKDALPAAKAAYAAGLQGKFWEMNDLIFANQGKFTQEDFENHAKSIKLNLDKFKAAMNDPKAEESIKADQAQAQKLGASGTPAFFIDGKFLSGAQPFESFKAIIDEEIKKSEEMLKAGVKKDKLYDEKMKKIAEMPPPSAPSKLPKLPSLVPGLKGLPERAGPVKEIAVGGSPYRGSANAPVTLVEFSDFQ